MVRNTTTRRFAAPRLPLERVHVEVTSHCNFACEFCPNPHLQRAGGSMDFGLLTEILHEVAAVKLGRTVMFHQQGEPLLYARLAEGVAQATAVGLRTSVTTNGALLDDRRVDELLAAGLSELVISLQTPDPASFRIRGARGLDYPEFEARVVRAVRRVLRAEAVTEVRVAFLTKPLPRFTLPDLGQTWQIVERNAELHPLLAGWSERLVEGLPAAPTPEAIRRAVRRTGVLRRNELVLLPRLALEARPVGMWPMPELDWGRAWLKAKVGTCHGISEHIAILWNGDYAFCCADHNGRTSTARFQDLPILDYLDSEPVQAALSGFRRLRPSHPYCQLCLGGPHPGIVAVKTVGSILYFKVLHRLRRKARA